jgi:hypothetical protein
VRLTRSAALRCFGPILGKRPWRASLGFGSFLTFEFGQRVRHERFWHDTWHLWIYMSSWRLDGPHGLLVTSDSPRELIGRVVPRLVGHPLTAVEIKPRARSTTFEFGRRFILKVTPFSVEEETSTDPADYWLFFMPRNMVLTVQPRCGISIHRSDRPRNRTL